MEKKLKELVTCSRQEVLNYILAGVNIMLGILFGVELSLWYLLLFIPGALFMCMAIYWGIQYNHVEEEIAKEEDEERKKTLNFIDDLLENNSTEKL